MQQNLMTFKSSQSSNSKQCAEAMGDRIAELEAENHKLKESLENNNSGRLSKSDHIKYVNQLHEVYRGEIDKVEKEKNEITASFSSKLEDLKFHLRQLEDTLQTERTAKVQALNDLTFKRIEIEKLQEDHLQKLKEVRKQYEDRFLSLQKDVIQRDNQIDEFNQRA